MKNAKFFTCNSPLIKNLLLLSCLLFSFVAATAQAQGVIEGRITAANGNPIANGRVTIPGTTYNATSDSNGSYRLEVPAGTYELRVNRGGYAVEILRGVIVANGQTVTTNATLSAEMEQLVVMGRAMIEGSTASVLSIQRESMTVSEVSGSDEFSRLGDSTAADTLKRVTGITVEDNKFVVIRGQPKRYTSTLFNGSQLPSLDPIQQITPLDLFPSGVLSNIAVQKAYTADRAGSFGSGQVQLNTSGLPSEDFIEFSAGTGVNSTMDEDALEFNTGKDIWGGVNAILKLPAGIEQIQDAGTPIASLPEDERNALAQSFSNELAPGYLGSTGPDASFSIGAGKRFDLDNGMTFGGSLSLDYGQKVRVEQEENLFLRLGNNQELEIQDDFDTNRTKLNTGISGLFALTGEMWGHRLKSNTFWIRDTTEKTIIDEGVFNPSDIEWNRRFTLEYEQREMLVQQFTGSHDFEAIILDWRFLGSKATRELPDRRSYQLQNTEIDGTGIYGLDTDATDLQRNFTSVEEDTYSAGIDLTLPLNEAGYGGISTSLKGGFDYDFRDRISEQRLFGFNTNGSRFRSVENIFADENIGVDITFSEFGGVANDYSSEIEILGGYLQFDMEMLERFRLVLGARLEDADFRVQTFEAGGAAGAVGVESGFEQQKVLPSLVGSWFLSENSQLRAGLTRSLSYPATVEVANTNFTDTESDESFIGNPALDPTIIDSADLRWEWYPSRSEALTVGAFYKDFTDPIERSFVPVGGGRRLISFVNAEKGEVYGLEFNSYFGLDTLAGYVGQGVPGWMSNMYFGANFSWQESEVEQDPATTTATNPVRRMTGQPDTLLNAQLGYTGTEHIVTVKFGRVGERLITSGVENLPDEFLSPRLDLGMKWSWSPTRWEALQPLTVSLEVENLLNDAYERTQGDFITRTYKTGVSGSLSVKWRFDGF